MDKLTENFVAGNHICVYSNNLKRAKAEFLLGQKIVLEYKNNSRKTDYILCEFDPQAIFPSCMSEFYPIAIVNPCDVRFYKAKDGYYFDVKKRHIYVFNFLSLSESMFDHYLGLTKIYRQNKFLFNFKNRLATTFWDFDFGQIRELITGGKSWNQ